MRPDRTALVPTTAATCFARVDYAATRFAGFAAPVFAARLGPSSPPALARRV